MSSTQKPWIVSASLATLDAGDPTQDSEPGALREFALRADQHGLDFLVLHGPADTLSVASWLMGATERLGLVPVLQTSHAQPFHAARALASMDCLSGGRMGWLPCCASAAESARSAEYLAAAQALWNSWDADALIIDQGSALYLDSAKIRRVDFRGEFFRVMGPLNAARPPQGYPVLVADDAQPDFEQNWQRADALLIGAPNAGAAQDRIGALRARGAKRIILKVRCMSGARAAAADSTCMPLNADADSAQLQRQLQEWRSLGHHGVHLLPDAGSGALAAQLPRLLRELRRDALAGSQPSPIARPNGASGVTLRSRLGLPQPINSYSAPSNRIPP